MSCDSLELILFERQFFVCFADFRQCHLPSGWNELVISSDQWRSQPLGPQAITGESCLVIDPLLVDVVIQPWKYSHHLHTSCVHSYILAHCVQDINRLGVLQLPRSSS